MVSRSCFIYSEALEMRLRYIGKDSFWTLYCKSYVLESRLIDRYLQALTPIRHMNMQTQV